MIPACSFLLLVPSEEVPRGIAISRTAGGFVQERQTEGGSSFFAIKQKTRNSGSSVKIEAKMPLYYQASSGYSFSLPNPSLLLWPFSVLAFG